MTPTISAASVPLQTAAAALPPPVETATAGAGQSGSPDLERLRALVAGTPSTGGYVEVSPPPPTETITSTTATERSSFETLGDSILNGISNFNSGYNQSLETINTKLEYISSDNALKVGNDFGEIMGLQVEIARWSMSVMGVDNASKAGTNTVKELSKGA